MQQKAMCFGLVIALWISGCAQWVALEESVSESVADHTSSGVLPETFINHAVPRLFSRNLGPNCALISLQMVLAYQGIATSLDQLQSQLSHRVSGGAIRFSDLVDIASLYDVHVFYIHEPSTYQLRAFIAVEFALLVASRGYGPNTGHARVLIGYEGRDDQQGTFYLLDPNYGRTVQESCRKYVLQAHSFAVLVVDRSYTREKIITQLAPYFPEGEPLPEIRKLVKP